MQLYTATTLLIPRELSITILSFVVFFFFAKVYLMNCPSCVDCTKNYLRREYGTVTHDTILSQYFPQNTGRITTTGMSG